MTNNETKKEVKTELNSYNSKQIYSKKDKEKDISIVQNFLDKVEKRLKQKEY